MTNVALLVIECTDKHQKSIHRGIQMTPKLCDFVFQLIELALARTDFPKHKAAAQDTVCPSCYS